MRWWNTTRSTSLVQTSELADSIDWAAQTHTGKTLGRFSHVQFHRIYCDRTVFWFGLVMSNLFLIISAFAKIHMLPCMKHHEALSGSMVKVLHRSRILRLLLGCGSYRSSGDACRTSAWVLEGLGAVRCPEDLTMS